MLITAQVADGAWSGLEIYMRHCAYPRFHYGRQVRIHLIALLDALTALVCDAHVDGAFGRTDRSILPDCLISVMSRLLTT